MSLLWWFGGQLAVKSVANVVNGCAFFRSGKSALLASLFFHRFGQLHLFAIGFDERCAAEDYSLGRDGVGCYLLPGMNPEKESMR